GKLLRPLLGMENFVTQVEFSPEGKYLAASGMDEVVRLWNVRTSQEVRRFMRDPKEKPPIHNICRIAFAPVGQTLPCGSWDRTIRLYDVATGRLIRRIAGKHEGSIYSLAFSPDGTRLASGSADTTVLVWEVNPKGKTENHETHGSHE